MSLYGMMRTGVSGMNAQSNRLGTVADNIANSGTTGYKRSSTEFSTLVLPSSQGSYSSGAVKTTIRTAIGDQGLLQFTNSALDLAVQGDGFFVVTDAGGVNRFLTRAGSFVEDKDGYMVNAAGFYLMAANTNGTLERAQVDRTTPSAAASTSATITANLPSQAEIGTTFTRTVTVYGGQGQQIPVELEYRKTGDNEWEVDVGDETLTFAFDESGTLTPPVGPVQVVVDAATGQQVTFDLGATTQLATAYEALPASVDGFPAGTPDELEIGVDGRVTALSDTGASRFLFQIPLARVASPDNLTVIAGNVFQENQRTGESTLGLADSGNYGKIVSGALEGSNVDIAEELTSMIESQRNYTANSKVFQTGSELLDVLVNLKR
ncbi:flagellar hook protein FlgE [Aliihoeflea sp. PC F10.4]